MAQKRKSCSPSMNVLQLPKRTLKSVVVVVGFLSILAKRKITVTVVQSTMN